MVIEAIIFCIIIFIGVLFFVQKERELKKAKEALNSKHKLTTQINNSNKIMTSIGYGYTGPVIQTSSHAVMTASNLQSCLEELNFLAKSKKWIVEGSDGFKIEGSTESSKYISLVDISFHNYRKYIESNKNVKPKVKLKELVRLDYYLFEIIHPILTKYEMTIFKASITTFNVKKKVVNKFLDNLKNS